MGRVDLLGGRNEPCFGKGSDFFTRGDHKEEHQRLNNDHNTDKGNDHRFAGNTTFGTLFSLLAARSSLVSSRVVPFFLVRHNLTSFAVKITRVPRKP